ncbi:MAG TPA: M56 family metallopeptidase, partial [Pirellulales bacterium]|nr:M56 family metallopeptidase [Pirellulales bacterium]
MNALADAVNRLAETWWTFAANVSWQAAIVGLAALLLVRFSRRQPAPLRYGLLLIALIKFACPPMLAAPIGLFSRWTPAAWRQAAADATSLVELDESAFTRPPARRSPHQSIDDAALPPVVAAPTNAKAASPSEASVVEPDEIELAPASARPQLRDIAQRAPSDDTSSSRVPLSWKTWLMLLHLTGMLLLAGWTAWQLRLLGRLVRSSREVTAGPRYEQFLTLCQTLKLRRPPRLLESREAVSPMALGLWRPSVLIPAGVLEAL